MAFGHPSLIDVLAFHQAKLMLCSIYIHTCTMPGPAAATSVTANAIQLLPYVLCICTALHVHDASWLGAQPCIRILCANKCAMPNDSQC